VRLDPNLQVISDSFSLRDSRTVRYCPSPFSAKIQMTMEEVASRIADNSNAGFAAAPSGTLNGNCPSLGCLDSIS